MADPAEIKPNAAAEAVLIMAHGTPDDLDELDQFLAHIRGGRAPSADVAARVRQRYERIGGRSPLTSLTLAQADALETELHRRGRDAKVYVGMRHWRPWIRDAAAAMAADGVAHATAIVMTPHFSAASVGRYQQEVRSALAELGAGLTISCIDSWAHQPALLDLQEARLRAALEALPTPGRVKVFFTAHSLPTRLLPHDDPYPRDLEANAATIATRLGDIDWALAYQSASPSGQPWLGPDLLELLPDLAGAGYTHVVVSPLGTVCDHVETLYDIDVEAREIAAEHGLTLTRTEAMNTDKRLICAVADAVAAMPATSNVGGA